MQQDFKNYRIVAEIGSGGLGKVYRAIDERTGKIVAVKVLHKKYQKSRRFSGIFHRELMIVSRLKHKHIVNCLDANFEPPNCFIVSEFIDGWSLYHIIKKLHRLPPLVSLCIAFEVLQGIDYLHLHDMIHSDLSSPNVLIDQSGRAYVTDFGLSFEEHIEDYRNYMVGTPGYYSPEHITDTAIVPQSDLYCVGLLLYEMITGTKAVVSHKDRGKTLKGMKSIDYGRIQIADRGLRRKVVKLLKGSLHTSVRRRISTAELMLFDVYSILKKYNIRYSRHGILQTLIDSKLVSSSGKSFSQNIYHGFVR